MLAQSRSAQAGSGHTLQSEPRLVLEQRLPRDERQVLLNEYSRQE